MVSEATLLLTFDGDDQTQNITLRFGATFFRVAYAPVDFSVYAGYGRGDLIREVRAGERVEFGVSTPVDSITIYWPIGAAVPDAGYAQGLMLASNQPLYSSGASEQGIALAVYDSLGQIRGWHPLVADTSVVERVGALVTLTGAITIDTTTPLDVDVVNVPDVSVVNIVQVTPQQLSTYDVVPRRTARDYSQAYTFGAAGRQVMNSLWLPSGGSSRMRLLSADVAVMDASAACEVWIDLMRITSQPTGGTSYTPTERYTSQSAASTEVRKQPSGGAAETGDALSSVAYKLGITGAVSTVNPAPPIAWQPLYRPYESYERNHSIVANKGLAVVIDCNAAAVVRAISRLSFMEE